MSEEDRKEPLSRKGEEKQRKVMITGASGQLAYDLQRVLGSDCRIFPLAKGDMDVTEQSSVNQWTERIGPDVVIHAAAYTRVDEAETNRDQAFRINALGTRNVAVAAQKCGAKLVYISTDYVFDGKKNTPYHEFDSPSPINVYGVSKLSGEEWVKSFHERFFIVRTSWLFGRKGINFVKKILANAEKQRVLKVTCNEIGSPTYAFDLAAFIAELIGTEKYGIYHAANEGQCSRFEFAQAILREAGMSGVRLIPVLSEELRLPANRPQYSALEGMAARLEGFPSLRHWKRALSAFFQTDMNG